jgi:signal transduction histidine kinase
MERVPSIPRARADWLVALGLGAAAQLEVWIWWIEDEQGPKSLAACALLLMSAALLWRRRAPLPSLGAICAVYAAWILVDTPAGSLLPFVILLVAVFTVAQREPPRRALVGGVVGLATIWLQFAVTDNDVANYAFTGVFLVAAWLGGRGFQSRDERAGALEARAARLEVEREEKARAAVAEERARIARELHDVVAHNVSVIVIQSQAAQQSTERESEAGTALRSIEATGQEALTEMRRLLGLLRKEDEELALAPQPSLRHLDRLVQSVRDAGLPVEVEVQGDAVALPPGVDLSAYRIVQEALTNALKHAGPARARVLVRYGPQVLELEISDDGPGIASGNGGGHGLVGMRERASVYGGVVESGSPPEGGYAIRVRLPLDPAHR